MAGDHNSNSIIILSQRPILRQTVSCWDPAIETTNRASDEIAMSSSILEAIKNILARAIRELQLWLDVALFLGCSYCSHPNDLGSHESRRFLIFADPHGS